MILAVESSNVFYALGLWDSLANSGAGAYDVTSTVTVVIRNPDGTTLTNGTTLATVTLAYVAGTVTVTTSGGVVVATSAGGNYRGQLSAATAFVSGTQYAVELLVVPAAGVAYQYSAASLVVAQYEAVA